MDDNTVFGKNDVSVEVAVKSSMVSAYIGQKSMRLHEKFAYPPALVERSTTRVVTSCPCKFLLTNDFVIQFSQLFLPRRLWVIDDVH